jgi:pentatricopeptide repeat protein
VFDEGPKHEADTWNSMISAYAQYGKGQEAVEMLSLMEEEGVAPNELTFVSVLTGCNHGGLILEGCWCFDSMDRDHGIKPRAEHYNCLIDMLGRVGRLDEANHLIDKVPLTCTALLSLLASCRQHPADVALGERVSNRAIMADPLDCTPYIMMQNIYAMSCNSQDEELG